MSNPGCRASLDRPDAVRSHLASISAKTGTSRQSDLVRVAAKLGAPIGRVTPAE